MLSLDVKSFGRRYLLSMHPHLVETLFLPFFSSWLNRDLGLGGCLCTLESSALGIPMDYQGTKLSGVEAET